MTQYNGLQSEANKFIPSELLDSRALSGLKPTLQRSKAARVTKGLDEAALQKLEQAEKTGGGAETVAKEDEEEDDEVYYSLSINKRLVNSFYDVIAIRMKAKRRKQMISSWMMIMEWTTMHRIMRREVTGTWMEMEATSE